MQKLKLEKRETLGKKVKALRREGTIPTVVYNTKGESFNTKISKKDAENLYRHTTSTTILDAEFEGREFKCLIKDFDINSLTGEINHISIFEIDENAPMVFTVPFTLVGVSPAVKNNLGILVNTLDDIDVKCQLSKLQPEIEVDISQLTEVGQTITVEDIKLPEGMTLVNEDMKTAAIATITEAQKVEEIEPVVEEGEEGAEEGETEGEAPAEEETKEVAE
ncbi:MAG: 50S ribosomal protein L25 [Candidatus Dojkabacteria bacterium]